MVGEVPVHPTKRHLGPDLTASGAGIIIQSWMTLPIGTAPAALAQPVQSHHHSCPLQAPLIIRGNDDWTNTWMNSCHPTPKHFLFSLCYYFSLSVITMQLWARSLLLYSDLALTSVFYFILYTSNNLSHQNYSPINLLIINLYLLIEFSLSISF